MTDRDDQGVVLKQLLPRMKKMLDSAEGDTPDARLADWLGLAIAAAGLGPERSKAAFDAALDRKKGYKSCCNMLTQRESTDPRYGTVAARRVGSKRCLG